MVEFFKNIFLLYKDSYTLIIKLKLIYNYFI